ARHRLGLEAQCGGDHDRSPEVGAQGCVALAGARRRAAETDGAGQGGRSAAGGTGAGARELNYLTLFRADEESSVTTLDDPRREVRIGAVIVFGFFVVLLGWA